MGGGRGKKGKRGHWRVYRGWGMVEEDEEGEWVEAEETKVEV